MKVEMWSDHLSMRQFILLSKIIGRLTKSVIFRVIWRLTIVSVEKGHQIKLISASFRELMKALTTSPCSEGYLAYFQSLLFVLSRLNNVLIDFEIR